MRRATFLRTAALLVLLGAALRLAAFDAARPLRIDGDEVYYVQVASNLARDRGHVYVGGMEGPARAWRPPAQAWLLSRLIDAEEPEPSHPAKDASLLQRLAWSQLALGTLLVALTVALGRALFDARTGLVAGAVVALYPALVVQSHYFWSENLFTALVTLAILGSVAAERRPGWALIVLTGIAFGAAALTRELALCIAGVCAVWWIWLAPRAELRGALARGAVLLGVALLTILPWTLRNHQLFDRLVPVSTIGWYALAEGNCIEEPRWLDRFGPVQAQFRARYFSSRDEMDRLDIARRHAVDSILDQQPGWLGKKLVRNLALLWEPDSLLRRKIRRGSYGDRPPPLIRLLFAASTPFYLALMGLGVVGMAGSRDRGRRALPAMILGVVCVIHVIANATPRFRVPWIPLLAIYASYSVVHWRSLRPGRSPRAWLAAFAVLVFFFTVCVPYDGRFAD
jgi:4-amino-4-deoxy-L-arabinose transferase-like glycosyltransferase